MNEWIEWNGGEMPVPGNTVVDIKCFNTAVFAEQIAGCCMWNRIDGYRIVAYRITQPEQKTEPTDAPKTLRDEFAMAALTGILANTDLSNSTAHEFAEIAYGQADAMMTERRK